MLSSTDLMCTDMRVVSSNFNEELINELIVKFKTIVHVK